MAATGSQKPIDQLLKWLDPFTSVCLRAQAEERVPRWATWFVRRYVRWYLLQTFAPAVHQANAQGIGYIETWMPPETPVEAVTAWFETQIMESQPTRIGAVHYILCYVFHCSPDEQPTVAWNNVPPPEREIGQWDGPMREWWREGAAVIAGLVPHDHGGLYLLANRVGDALTAYRGKRRAYRLSGIKTRSRAYSHRPGFFRITSDPYEATRPHKGEATDDAPEVAWCKVYMLELPLPA